MNLDRLLSRFGSSFKPLPHVLAQLEGAPLSPDGYQNFVFQWDLPFYEERVEMVQFTGQRRVLDAGCGFGQWSAALAKFNEHVVAMDRAENMVETTRLLTRRWERPNVEARIGALPDIDEPDESFDLVWCSGVLMFTDRDATMKQFHRVLRPGGRLYVMMNGRGRWLYKTLTSITRLNRRRLKVSLRAYLHGADDSARPSYLGLKDVSAFAQRYGFEHVAAASDGCIDLSDHKPPRRRPMFREGMLGYDNNIEFVLRRR